VRSKPGQRLTLRVRPVAVSIVEGPPDPAAVEAFVDWIEPLPLQRSQRIACRAGKIALSVEASQDEPLRVEDRVWLRIDPSQVQVFDGQTGANLSLGRVQ
jgi:ABC-type sugar transport system ATPase subunit